MYRVLKAGPVLGAGGKKLGTMVSYASETPVVAEIEKDADEIVGALGLEMQLSGETALIVQANVGYDPRKAVSRSVAYDVVFELRDGRWVRAPRKEPEVEALDKIDGSPRPPDDPSFPFDALALESAARAAERWSALLDAGDVSASAAGTTQVFQAQTSVEQWRAVVAERSQRAGGERRELYRMQAPSGKGKAPGVAAILVYDVRPPQGGRFLERIMLVNEQKDGWRTGGYAFQPVPPEGMR
jgi:hypothetical protein